MLRHLFLIVPFLLLVHVTSAVALPSCPTDPTAYFDNCEGFYDFGDGNTYLGEWKDDKRHGQGSYTNPNGDKHVGEWRDDQPNGHGTYTWADGRRYVGEFRDGLSHGYGTFTHPNGEKYVGEWRDDQPNGHGTYTWADGRRYVGDFRDGKSHGQGTQFWADGDVWVGQFSNDEWVSGNKYTAGNVPPEVYASGNENSYQSLLPPCPTDPTAYFDNCEGFYDFGDGNTYVGEWRDDKKHGQGTYTWADGTKYVGEYRDDKKHGHGTYTWADGEKHVGEYRNGQKHGHGTYTYVDGDKYVGEFRDDMAHGHGIYTYALNSNNSISGRELSGSVCDCNWLNGEVNGNGTVFWPNGDVWVGRMSNNDWLSGNKYTAGNVPPEVYASRGGDAPRNEYLSSPECQGDDVSKWHNCRGTLIADELYGKWEGDRYVGEFKNGLFHGHGTYYSSGEHEFKGDRYVGEYRDGKMHGQGTYTHYISGERYVGEFKDNKKHGQGTHTWLNGDEYTGDFWNSLPGGHGTYTFAYGDKYIGEVWNGMLHGQGIYYFSVNRHALYLGRNATGLIRVGEFVDNKGQGNQILYWRNGDVWVGRVEGNLGADGTDHGRWLEGNKYTAGNVPAEILASKPDDVTNSRENEERREETPKQNEVIPQKAESYDSEEILTQLFLDRSLKETVAEMFQTSLSLARDLVFDPGVLQELSPNTFSYEERIEEWGLFRLELIYKPESPAAPYLITFRVLFDKEPVLSRVNLMTEAEISSLFRGAVEIFRPELTLIGKLVKQGDYNPFLIFHNFQPGVFPRIDQVSKENNACYPSCINPEWHGLDDFLDIAMGQQGNNGIVNLPKLIAAASGSGFVISDAGHIVTNHHVIDGCTQLEVYQKGNRYRAIVVETDIVNDLAILKADFTPTTVFSINNANAELLQDVYVAGYPFGDAISTSVKVTKGIVSSLSGIGNNYSNIQIDAALQPGNSGGPILDDAGNVVGVAVAKLDLALALEVFDVVPEDTNFGIKSSVLKSFLEANGIETIEPSTKALSRTELGKKITDGTLFLSCLMTYAQIEKLRAEKVMFSDLD